MAGKPIVVVGSSNIDLVCISEHIPVVGETILGGDFIMAPGGKGANQAVAAAKLGAKVFFVAKLGEDVFAGKSLDNFKAVGIDAKYVKQTNEAPSGVALIMVDEKGNNSIVVAPGANSKLTPGDVEMAKDDIAGAGAVVAQLEVPLETIEWAGKLAKEAGVPFILDPAPARKLSDELLARVDILTPNETEAQILTGVAVTDRDSAQQAASALLGRGVGTVIVTMGTQGYLFADSKESIFARSHSVTAVDSTAAGDAFTGALAAGIAEGKSIIASAEFASYVAALSVTQMGAQPSMPTAAEVEEFVKSKR
jgi:ribokinase